MARVKVGEKTVEVNVDNKRGIDILKEIGRKPEEVFGFKCKDKIIDIHTPISNDCVEMEVIESGSAEALEILRHSVAHIMAQAIQRIYGKGVKFGIGPTIKDGFYYDIDLPEGVSISDEDLPRIEEEMKKIISEGYTFEREELSKEEAIKLFEGLGQTYKIELINEIPEEKVSIYKQGEFIDLCRGPHIYSTRMVNPRAVKLLSVAGAYWRGIETNPMLTRIYGTAFFTEEELKKYLWQLEEAKKRDHRKLGKELKLFSFHPEGPGLPFWLPNGLTLKNILIELMRKLLRKNGYIEIQTPTVLRKELWEISGHWENYRENMFVAMTVEDTEPMYAVKPMSCPGAMLFFKEEVRSYKDLPMRVAEFGHVHRYERSGVLQGLFRVRGFTQDDAHIFMTPEQIKSETLNIINLVDKVYKVFGFSYTVDLSTRPEKYIGTEEQWELATNALKQALEEIGMEYEIKEGEGAFYGPKIDFHLEDAIGRQHQCGTIQLDMALPERFDLTYIGPDGQKHRVVMLHRAIYGSLERFIGILVEHYAGKFPLWLSPEQVRIIPISEKHLDFAQKVYKILSDQDYRVKLETVEGTLNARIRKAQIEKVPYMIIIGDKEVESNTITVRSRDLNKNIGTFKIEEFIDKILKEEAKLPI